MMNTIRRDSSWEGEGISLKVKVGYTDLFNIGEREKIIFDVINENEGSKSFC